MDSFRHVFPTFRLLHEEPNQKRDGGWDQTKQEDLAPSHFRVPLISDALDHVSYVGSQE